MWMMKKTTIRLRPKVQQELCENDLYRGRWEPQHKDKETKHLKRWIEEEIDAFEEDEGERE